MSFYVLALLPGDSGPVDKALVERKKYCSRLVQVVSMMCGMSEEAYVSKRTVRMRESGGPCPWHP